MTPEQYKQLSIKEFSEAAKTYDTNHAGLYEMCKDDYPQMLAELEKEPFFDVLDVGCGTGAVIALLNDKYPGRHYAGLDLTPEMIEVARTKVAPGMEFVVGDAEDLPFGDASFDAVLCSNSFHHYPNQAAFLAGALRVLRPGGRLILRDYTSNDLVVWLMNHFELPLAHAFGHGDVRVLRQRDFVGLLAPRALRWSPWRRRRASARTWWREDRGRGYITPVAERTSR